ncbi:hypothetical protein KSP40_PGU020598 [Platanthera guangdongensis]|uniref:Uncharacterized protein n=1 Tax=Platanthera guangdongensis TaxID=2320717 RepID=A0ABR2MF41_9ASPA
MEKQRERERERGGLQRRQRELIMLFQFFCSNLMIPIMADEKARALRLLPLLKMKVFELFMGLVLKKQLLFPQGMLVVVHPHLENFPANSNIITELFDDIVVLFLQSPANSLGEAQHFLLLLGGESGPEAFAGGGGDHVSRLRRRRSGVGAVELVLAGGIGCRSAAEAGLEAEMFLVMAVGMQGRRREKQGQKSGRRRRRPSPARGVEGFAVEAAVAAAGGAFEGVVVEGHELAAAVEDVSADAGGVVLQAFFVARRAVAGGCFGGWVAGEGGSSGARVWVGGGRRGRRENEAVVRGRGRGRFGEGGGTNGRRAGGSAELAVVMDAASELHQSQRQ